MDRALRYSGVLADAAESLFGWTALCALAWYAPLLSGVGWRFATELLSGSGWSAVETLPALLLWVAFLFPACLLAGIAGVSWVLILVPLYGLAAWWLPLMYDVSLKTRAIVLGVTLVVSAMVSWWTNAYQWVGIW